jgi:hypothetical protein
MPLLLGACMHGAGACAHGAARMALHVWLCMHGAGVRHAWMPCACATHLDASLTMLIACALGTATAATALGTATAATDYQLVITPTPPPPPPPPTTNWL